MKDKRFDSSFNINNKRMPTIITIYVHFIPRLDFKLAIYFEVKISFTGVSIKTFKAKSTVQLGNNKKNCFLTNGGGIC